MVSLLRSVVSVDRTAVSSVSGISRHGSHVIRSIRGYGSHGVLSFSDAQASLFSAGGFLHY